MPPSREASSPRPSGRPAKRARTHQVGPTRSRRPLPSTEPPPSEGVYVEAANTITVAVESSDTQPLPPLARYKAWKKSGGLHDAFCFVCQEPGILVPCDTCRRSYHDAHKPPTSSKALHGDSSLWYCDVCVDRGWHSNPPIITPPSSPHRRKPAQAAEGVSEATQQSTSLDPSPARPELPVMPARLVSAEQPENRAARSRNPPVRKSRFTTLPTEVDSALAVVYRELESVPTLQTKVSELEAETKRLQQVISMQRNEMTMMQTAVNKTANLQAELQTLRGEAAERDAERSEKGELERKNRELESELGRAKEELEERNRTLQEWKRKLSSLIGE
ncbi:hypothetical protein CKAH01_05269 [Colletotrichum kahawae]|uniref:PHD-type domain-containing protein n=1 Tax=Colletotrichum kahawae TaxID=34407 RepID=A0AAD9YF98_COLKA|nr:hypothetical protein CKAH01_05269 [Colletotrichum kahawae]